MADGPELTPEIIALSVVVRELIEVLPKRQARAFLRGMSFVMSGRDGWNEVVPALAKSDNPEPLAAERAAAWWATVEPVYRRAIDGT